MSIASNIDRLIASGHLTEDKRERALEEVLKVHGIPTEEIAGEVYEFFAQATDTKEFREFLSTCSLAWTLTAEDGYDRLGVTAEVGGLLVTILIEPADKESK